MSNQPLFQKVIAVLVLLTFFPLSVGACATCGCSEVCTISVMDATGSTGESTILSESIWGNMILRMAFLRDTELLRLSRKLNIAVGTSIGVFAGVAAGTMGQGIVSMAVLNPPEGALDSPVPGAMGIGLSSVTSLAIGAREAFRHKYRKQMRSRQLVVRQEVEQILQHLEFSKTECPDSQKELSALIGERAANDCIQLWQSSHATATASGAVENTVSEKPEQPETGTGTGTRTGTGTLASKSYSSASH